MNCKDAKNLSIVSYLNSIGVNHTKKHLNDYWYLSPLRSESTASFKVNDKLNVWYDHGLGKGGNLIDFGVLFHNCKIEHFLNILKGADFSFQQPPMASGEVVKAEKNEVKIEYNGSIKNAQLFAYLIDRGIEIAVIKKYCLQIDYQSGSTKISALAFKNNSGGYELRTQRLKSTISPKDFTFIEKGNYSAVAVFEGFIDFLSFCSTKTTLLEEPTNFIILNSLSFFERAKPVMESYQKVYLFLDNDAAGSTCTKIAMDLSTQFLNMASKYSPHKDLNDWLMKEKSKMIQRDNQGLGM